MLTDDYTVRLEAFQGPLDLLLFLIRRAEVEITEIPIAQIADQYVEHLKGIERIDIDLAGDFLVMAATLMEIKSRLIGSSQQGDEQQQDQNEEASQTDNDQALLDPREELVQQLLEYKKYRDAADALERRRDEWALRFPAGRAATDRNALRQAEQEQADDQDLEDLKVYDLVEAYARIAQQMDFSALGAHRIELDEDDTPIEVHAEDILDRLRRRAGSASLRALLDDRPRGQKIGLFVAALELARRRAVVVEQDGGEDEVVLRLIENEPDAEEEAPEPAG